MTRIKTPFLLLCAIALCAAPALAGPLALDTTTYLTTWHGSTPYNNGSGLSGDIDWAVYGPNAFPAGFGGYGPTANEWVYTYQVRQIGLDPLSQFIVSLYNPADNIGSFTGNNGFGPVAGITPDLSALSLSSASWSFFSGIEASQTSEGLVFSSPNPPMMVEGAAIDGGVPTFFIPLPSPDGPLIPEPSTLVLASCGLAALGLQLLRRRRRREG